MPRRIIGLGVAALSCLALAGVANAEPTSFSGTVRNGGCDGVRPVNVSGASRIEIQVSSTDATPNLVYGQIIAPNGNVVAQHRYDTPGGGTYYVQVCSYYDHISPPNLQFTARYASGPAGQPALPQTAGGVLGARTRLGYDPSGSGAIRTKAGLAWFTIKVGPSGLATLRVFNPMTHTRTVYTGVRVSQGQTVVRLVRGKMHLTIAQFGASEKLTFRSPRFKANGYVVRGGYIVL
jgi:hypothetical protein